MESHADVQPVSVSVVLPSSNELDPSDAYLMDTEQAFALIEEQSLKPDEKKLSPQAVKLSVPQLAVDDANQAKRKAALVIQHSIKAKAKATIKARAAVAAAITELASAEVKEIPVTQPPKKRRRLAPKLTHHKKADLYNRTFSVETDAGFVIYPRAQEEVSQLAQFLEAEWRGFHKDSQSAQSLISFVIGQEGECAAITICAKGCESYDKSQAKRIQENQALFEKPEWKAFKKAKVYVSIRKNDLSQFPIIDMYTPAKKTKVKYSTASIYTGLGAKPEKSVEPDAKPALTPPKVAQPVLQRVAASPAPTISHKI